MPSVFMTNSLILYLVHVCLLAKSDHSSISWSALVPCSVSVWGVSSGSDFGSTGRSGGLWPLRMKSLHSEGPEGDQVDIDGTVTARIEGPSLHDVRKTSIETGETGGV